MVSEITKSQGYIADSSNAWKTILQQSVDNGIVDTVIVLQRHKFCLLLTIYVIFLAQGIVNHPGASFINND